jgi:bacterioferritin-associated ferredoxin
MTSLTELTKGLKQPPRKEIEDAIRAVALRTEELADTTGTCFGCGDVRALAWAAHKYLELAPSKPAPRKPRAPKKEVV